jgi:Tfp pilus assembly protein PilO
MTAPRTSALVSMPARQLQLVLAAVLMIMVALLWTFAIRVPLAALKAQQAERARLERAGADPQRAAREESTLKQQIAAIEGTLGLDGARLGDDPARLRLIDGVQRSAARHNVVLRSVAPGPARPVARFQELPVEVQAQGSYAGVQSWLHELGQAAPTAAVVSFDMQAGARADQRTVRVKVAVYQLQETAP